MRRTISCVNFFFRKRLLPLVSMLPAVVTVLPHAAPIADGKAKFLGNISPLWGSVPATFNEYWNQVTPENSGKWLYVERRRDTMRWSLDTSYFYAKDNGMPFKQHTFLWGNQRPSWIDSLTPEEQREEVEEWIQLFGEHYPDVDFIDVVNEPINNPAPYREALGGEGETGWDWIVWAYEKARQYCPNARLLINEFNLVNNAAIVDRYLEIIKLLQERGLIHGIGIQSHYWSLEETAFSPDIIRSTLDRLAETGLQLYPSELDIRGDDTTQLMNYRKIFPAYWEHPAVAGITLWGWIEDATWEDSTYLLHKDGTERPALAWLRKYVTGEIGSVQGNGSIKNSGGPITVQSGPDGSLRLRLDRHAALSLRIVDLRGRTIVPMKSLSFPAGTHDLFTAALKAPAGICIVIVEAGGAAERYVWVRPGAE
ncbi:MAG: endo-1,4-beta-xylanase [Chitinispirillaceae bacterium]|nr:endo-1,4-beta-xylanase [Chitinispirillaceae bacterium]